MLMENEVGGGGRKGGDVCREWGREGAKGWKDVWRQFWEEDGNCPAQLDNEAFKKLFHFSSSNSYC